MRAVFLIEYAGVARAFWIAAIDTERHAIPTTSNIEHARRFANEEDARHEILRLGLSSAWQPKERGMEL